MKTIFDELQQEVKNWWISLILGILYVIVAISLMFSPLSGYAVLSILFSVSMLFSGLLEISFVNPEKPDVPLNKNDAFQKVQKRRVQEKR